MNCLAKAICNSIDCNIVDLFNFIGATGDEIIFPDNSYPYDRRGFTLNEVTSFCLSKGYAFVIEDFDNQLQCHFTNKIITMKKAPKFRVPTDAKIIYAGIDNNGVHHADVDQNKLTKIILIIYLFRFRF